MALFARLNLLQEFQIVNWAALNNQYVISKIVEMYENEQRIIQKIMKRLMITAHFVAVKLSEKRTA